ncbi:hypothetical protein GE09DRAFT_1074791 [Coniochaeta sp. 2T2.1]|nr:hypothetical protein GE09DRAFT_1074791 [Coniochaeta sp. 2T2.1]
MGAGGLETRHHPEIISFRYPNMRANHELFGWEPPLTREDRFRRPPVETYLSVLKDRLGSIVQVTDLTFMTPRYHPASDNEFHCPASLMPVRGSHVKEKTTGIIYFVDAGIFFSSFTLPDDDERVTVLLPRPSIRSGNYTAILPADNLRTPSPIQELLRWQTGTVELNLNISRYRGVEAVMALKFADIEFSIFDLVRDYVRARGYALDEVVQTVDRAKRNPGSLVWADEV